MKLVSTQAEVGSSSILGMSEIEARATWARLFDEMSASSQRFLLGMAIDLAQEDPAPKKQQPAITTPVQLQLVCG